MIESHLTSLEASGLIRVAQLHPELEYLFRHALVQDAVYESLLRQDRKRLHRSVGQTLEQMYPERIDALAARLAHHFAEAGDEANALQYNRRAGDHAFAQYALSEAIMAYGAALDLATHMQPPDVPLLVHLALRKGRAFELQGDYPSALAVYERMEELAVRGHDQAALLAALLAQATIRSTPSTVYDGDKGIALSERAREIAERLGDRAAEARILWTLLLAYGFGRGDVLHAIELGERSAAISRELGLTEQLAYTLNDLGNVYMMGGRYAESEALLNESVTLWRSLDNPPMLAFSLNLLSQLSMRRGSLAQSVELASEALDLCHAINNLEGACFSVGLAAYAMTAQGHLGSAFASLREIIVLIEQANFDVPMSGSIYSTLALLSVETGMFDAARQIMAVMMERRHLEDLPVAIQGQWLVELGRLEVWLGEPGPAIQKLVEGFAQNFEASTSGMEILVFSGTLQTKYALLRGALDEALDLGDATLAALKRTGARLEIPDVLLMRGQALMRLGRFDETRAAFREALHETAWNDNRMIRWRILAALAELEAQHGDAQDAARCRREGRMLLDQVAASLPDPDMRAAFLAQPEAASLINSSAGQPNL